MLPAPGHTEAELPPLAFSQQSLVHCLLQIEVVVGLVEFLGCQVLVFGQTPLFVTQFVVVTVVRWQSLVVMLIESDVAVLVDFILVLVAVVSCRLVMRHLSLSILN